MIRFELIPFLIDAQRDFSLHQSNEMFYEHLSKWLTLHSPYVLSPEELKVIVHGMLALYHQLLPIQQQPDTVRIAKLLERLNEFDSVAFAPISEAQLKYNVDNDCIKANGLIVHCKCATLSSYRLIKNGFKQCGFQVLSFERYKSDTWITLHIGSATNNRDVNQLIQFISTLDKLQLAA